MVALAFSRSDGVAEDLARVDLGKDALDGFGHPQGDFHEAVLDDIDTVALVAFLENLLAGGKGPLRGNLAEGLVFGLAKIPEEPARFESDHAATVGER